MFKVWTALAIAEGSQEHCTLMEMVVFPYEQPSDTVREAWYVPAVLNLTNRCRQRKESQHARTSRVGLVSASTRRCLSILSLVQVGEVDTHVAGNVPHRRRQIEVGKGPIWQEKLECVRRDSVEYQRSTLENRKCTRTVCGHQCARKCLTNNSTSSGSWWTSGNEGDIL